MHTEAAILSLTIDDCRALLGVEEALCPLLSDGGVAALAPLFSLFAAAHAVVRGAEDRPLLRQAYSDEGPRAVVPPRPRATS